MTVRHTKFYWGGNDHVKTQKVSYLRLTYVFLLKIRSVILIKFAQFVQIEAMKNEREFALTHKDRLVKMMEDRDIFMKQLADARKSVFKVSSGP